MKPKSEFLKTTSFEETPSLGSHGCQGQPTRKTKSRWPNILNDFYVCFFFIFNVTDPHNENGDSDPTSFICFTHLTSKYKKIVELPFSDKKNASGITQ